MPNQPKLIKRAILPLSAAAALLLWFGSPAPAPAKDEWLPVPPEDLALKDNPKSPGAHAMILYRESSVEAHDSSVEEYIRIKIFTKEGLKEGDVEIPFVKGEDDIRDIRARTIHSDGSVVNFEGKPFEKTVVKISGFKYLAKTFTLPDLQPGCIIEYKYRDQSNPSFYFDNSWIIQEDLFTRLAKFSIRPDTSGNPPPLRVRSYLLPPDTAPMRNEKGVYTLEVHDLPGIEEEAFMAPDKQVKARVEFFYADRFAPDKETPQKYWERIGKRWSENLDAFLDKKGALSAEVARITNPTDSPEAKLRKIYARAQQIRNLSMEESKSDKEEKNENIKPAENVEEVLKHGYGYARQINCVFIGLARAAGFESTAMYLAPRNIGFFAPNSMDSTELNADVAWVRAGAQEYYLDPGARFFPFGSLPWYESSTKGIRVNKNGFDNVDTPFPPSADSTLVRSADLMIDADGSMTGTMSVDFTGQSGALRREEERQEDEAGRKKSLEDEIKNWLPQDCTFELTKLDNWENILLPLHVEGTLKSAGYGSIAGHRMLLPQELFHAAQAKAFQSEKRVNDLYFHYPYEEKDEVKLRAPAGYKIENAPSPQNVDFGAVKYQISAASQGDTLDVKRHLVIDLFMVPVSKYPALRSFFGTVKKNDDAEVVLQNADSSKGN